MTRDKRNVLVSISQTLLRDETDAVLGTIAIIRDMTEMRHLERQIVQNEKLALIGQIAAGIAHEIGTPLNIISGIAEVLLLDRPEEHVEREDLETVIGQTDRIANLIRELLAFARPQPLKRDFVDIAVELRRAAALLRGKAVRLGIEISIRISEGLPLLYADAHNMQQVFLNLLVNAIDALDLTDAGSERAIRIEAEAVESELVIRISDTGPGMKPELLARIFEPFVTTKDVGKGTGLGLAVCRRIVEEHGGSIEASSEESRGSVFTIRFTVPGT
jgi:signal transduction histidine kinase